MPSLNFGDGVWLQVRRDSTWDQPASSDPSSIVLAGRTALADSRIPVMDIVDHPPPIASLITVGTPAPDGTTTVFGAPGAVPAQAVVLVASLAYADPDFVRANEDGSFDAEIPAAPGDIIQIRYRVDLVFNPNVEGNLLNKTHWPGTLVGVPQSEPASGFSSAYFHNVAGGILHGFASGTVSETRLAAGESTRVAGTIAFRIPAGAVAPLAGSYRAEISLSPLFDAGGNQVSAGTDYISHLLTPTGLPIERGVPGGQRLGPLQVTPLERVGDLLTGSFDGSGTVQAGVPDGTYSLVVGFGVGPEFEALGFHTGDTPGTFIQLIDGFVSAAIVTVGDPVPLRLAIMLLTNSASQGQRGSVARWDAERIALTNRIAAPGRRPRHSPTRPRQRRPDRVPPGTVPALCQPQRPSARHETRDPVRLARWQPYRHRHYSQRSQRSARHAHDPASPHG